MSDRLLKESDVLKLSYALPLILNSTFYEMVKSLPTAEEIVRCKDCRWYKQKQKNLPYNQSKSYCNRSCVVATKENDFCSYGERSE